GRVPKTGVTRRTTRRSSFCCINEQVEHLPELFSRRRSLDQLSVDNERWRRPYLQLTGCTVVDRRARAAPVLPVAGSESLGVQFEFAGIAVIKLLRAAARLPLVLLRVQQVVHRPEAILVGSAFCSSR